MDLSKRETPQKYLQAAIKEFKARNGMFILEIGCMRQDVLHGAGEPCTEDCASRCDGHSTMYLAHTGAYMWSVDASRLSVRCAQKYVEQYPDCHVAREDGIEFIKRWQMPAIGLLYLDAWDVDLPDTAEKHLMAYRILRDRGLFTEETLILIDDCDLSYNQQTKQYKPEVSHRSGKGKLVIPQAEKDGFKVLMQGRQVLLG